MSVAEPGPPPDIGVVAGSGDERGPGARGVGDGPVVERQEHGLRSRGSTRHLRTIHKRCRLGDERQCARARLDAYLVQAPAGLPVPHYYCPCCCPGNLLVVAVPAAAAAPSPTAAPAADDAFAVRVPVWREELSGPGEYPEHRHAVEHAVAPVTQSVTRAAAPVAVSPGADPGVLCGEGRWHRCGLLEQIRRRGCRLTDALIVPHPLPFFITLQ